MLNSRFLFAKMDKKNALEKLDKLKHSEIREDGRRNNGGARKGGGRKKKLIKNGTQNEAFIAAVTEHWDELIASLFQLANGVKHQGVDKNGADVIYNEKPDRAALEYLFNRVLGRPKETMDIGGEIKINIDC